MKRKLIFFDIDGTIVSEKSHKILDSTIWAIEKARKCGHYAIINTGRTSIIVGDDFRHKIGFDGYLFGCGTSIYFQEKQLFHRQIPDHTTKKIVEELRNCKIDAVLEGEENSYIDLPKWRNNPEWMDKIINSLHGSYHFFEEDGLAFDKWFMHISKDSQFKQFYDIFSKDFDFINRRNGFYEVVPKGCSKASGIYYLSNYLKIPMEDTIAIGDSSNDIPMLSCVQIAVAMKNSEKEVLDMADYITTDVDEDGIYHALKWLGVLGDANGYPAK